MFITTCIYKMFLRKINQVSLIIVLTFFSSLHADNLIIISEIMNNPSIVEDIQGEWFEIYNADSIAVDLSGWIIKDNSSDHHIISESLIILPGEYKILANNNDEASNGGLIPDYQYTNFSLGNGTDEIILLNAEAEIMDSVAWDNGITFPDPDGASMALTNPSYDNTIGSNWTTSTLTFGDGDLGTPGLVNFFGDLVMEYSPFNFDTTIVSHTNQISRIINNIGNDTLFITELNTNSDEFQTSILSSAIPPETSTTLILSFSPIDYGNVTGVLSIQSSDPLEPLIEISLSGFGYQPVPHISVNQSYINFQNVMVGHSEILPLKIYNTGEAILHIDSIKCNNSVFVPQQEIFSIPPGDFSEIYIQFIPVAAQPYNELLSVYSNDPDMSEIQINLLGTGITADPDIAVNTDTLDFGNVIVGQISELPLKIFNYGTRDLEIEEITFGLGETSPFFVNIEEATIIPDDSLQITVSYQYTNQPIHNFEESMIISSNDPDEPGLEVILKAETHGGIIFVPDDIPTIQQAINVSLTGDTIIINPGTYYEQINIENKGLAIASQFLLTQDRSYIGNTIIHGGEIGEEEINFINISNIENDTLVFSGFTITGMTDVNFSEYTIKCDSSNIKLKDIIITENSSTGVVFNRCQVNLTAVNFINNGNDLCGGIICQNSLIEINNCKFMGNTADEVWEMGPSGPKVGAIHLHNSNANIINTLIANNKGGFDFWAWAYGAIYLDHSSANLINCLITDNTTDDRNDWLDSQVALYPCNNSSLNIFNSLVFGNSRADMFLYINNQVNIAYSFVDEIWGRSEIINWMEGNLGNSDMLLDPTYHLTAKSSCIGAGADSIFIDENWMYAPTTDIEGNSRPNPANSNPDIGPYEHRLATPEGSEGPHQTDSIPDFYSLEQNYPNPFNSKTTIKYQLPYDGKVSLIIYNILGQKVDNLINKHQEASFYSIDWDVTNKSYPLTNGIYFLQLRIEANNGKKYLKNMKMLYIK